MESKLVFFQENENGFVSARFDGTHLLIRHNELGRIAEVAYTRTEALALAYAIRAHFGEE